MGRDNGQGPLNTLKTQPGQTPYDKKSYHPLPGMWAQQQMMKESTFKTPENYSKHGESSIGHGRPQTEIQRALASERKQHEYWQEWQGVTPGHPEYEDPREFQNTLLPSAKYGTEGRGYA